MWIIRMGKKLNRKNKERIKKKAGEKLSPVRRIEKVAPIKGKRFVAMTFDDGPSMAAPNPWSGAEKGLTEVLLDTLNDFGAKGTFDVIGSTKDNYPDVKGAVHKADWGGVRYDHYPNFEMDEMAGAVHQKGLIDRIINEGHEVTNHGYKHIIFGPKRIIYGKRAYFNTFEEVVDDLRNLDQLLMDEHGYKMTLSRPPHYIDKINGGFDSYDAYQLMGYNYMAASFDGGGWLPTTGDYDLDVDKMVEPMRKALQADPESLNGQIIFQKDGFNMSEQTPVVDALPKQLALLKEYGYEVVTVSELLSEMPFEDIDGEAEYYDAVVSMNKKGYCIGYKNNTFQPERIATVSELYVMATEPKYFMFENESMDQAKGMVKDLYKTAKGHMDSLGCSVDARGELTAEVLKTFLQKVSIDKVVEIPYSGKLKRSDLIQVLDQYL